MSDNIKLIIEIPKEMHEALELGNFGNKYNPYDVCWFVRNGTPLDDDSERAETQAYFAGEAYGWEQGRKALIDDIKAEIRTCEIRHDFRIAEKDAKSRELMHGIFSDVYGVLARIGKAESEVKPNGKET